MTSGRIHQSRRSPERARDLSYHVPAALQNARGPRPFDTCSIHQESDEAVHHDTHAGKQMLRTVTRTVRRRFAAPATKKKKKKGKNDDDNPQDGATAFYRAILDAPRKTRPKFSEEEARRNFEIGARYNRLSRIKHCEFEAGLQLKLDLQQFALESLPPDLRKQAMSLDDVPLPPLDRRFWALTPPIPGFKPEAYPDDDED